MGIEDVNLDGYENKLDDDFLVSDANSYRSSTLRIQTKEPIGAGALATIGLITVGTLFAVCVGGLKVTEKITGNKSKILEYLDSPAR